MPLDLVVINPTAEDEIDFVRTKKSKKRLKSDWTFEKEEPQESVVRPSSRASSRACMIIVESPDPDPELQEGVIINLECNL